MTFKLTGLVLNNSKDEWVGRQCNSCPEKFRVGDTIMVIDHTESYVKGVRGVHQKCVRNIFLNARFVDPERQATKLESTFRKSLGRK